MKLSLLIALLAPLFFFGAYATAYAQTASAPSDQFVPLTTLPGIKEAAAQNDIAPFLSQLYKICIGLAAVLTVLQLMRAGVMYMGGDSITEKAEARRLIGTSLAGLLLVLSPVIVFSIINPSILNLEIGKKSDGSNALQLNDGSSNGSSGSSGSTNQTPAPGTSPSNPTRSTIDATGAVNPACRPMPDGTQIRTAVGSQQNSDEQCCVRQKVNGIACTTQWNYRDINNTYEYCSCPGK